MNIREWVRARVRAFVLGPGAVDPWTAAYGTDPEEWAPEEYGNYLATSNGVYACATLRASLLSSLPLRLYRVNSQGEQTEVTSGPAVALLKKVNPYWTLSRLVEMTELSLCLWGSAFWFLERGESARRPPTEIWWGRPDRVTVYPDPERYISHFEYEPAHGTETLRYETSEVIWFRYPNPLDEWSGLSPLAAARLAADTSSAAMKSNRNLFANGMQIGGMVYPLNGQIWSQDQAGQIEEVLSRRLKGVDKAHRWAIMRMEIGMNAAGVTPKDAEFLGLLRWTLEDICRAYRVPLDLIGGQRTYENVDAAQEAVWNHAVLPEARFLANEIVEQLLPMFPGAADLAEFDASEVAVLQEDRGEIVTQMKALWDMGVPLNKLLNEFQPELLDSQAGYEWGDIWWVPLGMTPADIAMEPPQPVPAQLLETEPEEDDDEEEDDERRRTRQAVGYGSAEHILLWRRWAKQTEEYEGWVTETVVKLFERQRQSILDKLQGERAATETSDVDGLAMEPFEMSRWVREFRVAMRELLRRIIGAVGAQALEDLGLTMGFDVFDPTVLRFLENRAQRFAERVCETTWEALKRSLMEGIEQGQSIPELAKRVEEVMGDRIRSTPTVIARTETIGASNGGTLMAWEQSGLVAGKSWLSALDERTRLTHIQAHGQTVGIQDNFRVGAGQGPAPGQIGLPEEDIQCRCAMTAVLRSDLLGQGAL